MRASTPNEVSQISGCGLAYILRFCVNVEYTIKKENMLLPCHSAKGEQRT